MRWEVPTVVQHETMGNVEIGRSLLNRFVESIRITRGVDTFVVAKSVGTEVDAFRPGVGDFEKESVTEPLVEVDHQAVISGRIIPYRGCDSRKIGIDSLNRARGWEKKVPIRRERDEGERNLISIFDASREVNRVRSDVAHG